MSSWLPADFTKQDAVKQAQVLGVSVRTMEKWIDKLVQSTDIVRVTHGKYQKRDCKYPTQFCIGHSGMNGVTGRR